MEAEAAEMPEAAVMVKAVQPGVAEAVVAMAEAGVRPPPLKPWPPRGAAKASDARAPKASKAAARARKGERRRMYDTP